MRDGEWSGARKDSLRCCKPAANANSVVSREETSGPSPIGLCLEDPFLATLGIADFRSQISDICNLKFTICNPEGLACHQPFRPCVSALQLFPLDLPPDAKGGTRRSGRRPTQQLHQGQRPERLSTQRGRQAETYRLPLRSGSPFAA